ncbi:MULTISPECIES: ferredoxin [unclassified Streptomyces]|uniref:ferredoxin n=1 Tax=unclassified Streptomyces TaxID=2593676 RepID=UPI002286C190|nr:ferredoxin [Streptomyces sp. Je 1-369]WAL95384.1 ferredoxin [Streptomyces sp. Je 1-369]
MRVIVDLDVCQDHGQCVFAAPDIFRLDDEGRLAYVDAPDAALRADAEDAADVCPLQAIRVEG